MMRDKQTRFLFLGVGGMGMAPLACWLSDAGYCVFGYDSFMQERVRRHLVNSGVELRDFVFEEHFKEVDQVVFSSAMRPDHPLMILANRSGLPCMRRGELLAQIANEKKLIAVAGSHGKTTTSGMIAYGIHRMGISASYVLGGLFEDESIPPARFCESDWMVAEIDESDGTIEAFRPEKSLILNIDWDHADHYSSREDLEAAFVGLALRTRDHVWMPREVESRFSNCKKVNYYDLANKDGDRLNQGNQSAAALALGSLGAEVASDLLREFPGMGRRQSTLFEDDTLTVIEDYAHHPTEIYALLRELRSRAGSRRLEVVFQPHRYSRTKQFRQSFAESLESADALWLLPVYGAHEQVVDGGGLDDLLDAFTGERPRLTEMSVSGIREVCKSVSEQPSLLAFVGAGDIEQFAGACVSTLRAGQDGALMDYLSSRTSEECVLKSDEPLATKTTMRVGGRARFFAEPANRGDLQSILRAADLFGVKTFCLGRGSNLIVSDSGFNGLVIRFSGAAWRRIDSLGEGRIWAAAGCRLKEICGFAAREGLTGFEFLEGIPGAVGGALRMNAGAMGSWIFDVVERVQFFDEDGIFRDWDREAFAFGYRRVEEISRGIALGAILKAVDLGEENTIRGRIDSYSSTRKESQPRGASAGCIFKNPEGSYAGKLIDEHGLKGLRIGGAEVSEVHGNFIVNSGGATSADIIELVREIRARIKKASGYELEPEVLLVGQSWDEVLGDSEDVG